ncbi:hypothetical protein ACLQ24_14020 [Micromonospora sp. DT4]|uniref:hypothetical protein n=1 Tax=Micromonospora sp. DT4 TaxID=3393438 RepID=UPI003CF2E04F
MLFGTSAGAVVGAQIASGTPLSELYERQRQGVPHETAPALGVLSLLWLARAQMFARSPEQAARRLGRLALSAHIDDPSRQRRIAEARRAHHQRVIAAPDQISGRG